MSNGIPYVYRLACAIIIPAVCVCFVSVVKRKLRPGWPRLVACLPIFALNFCAPSLFDQRTQLISNLILDLCFVWLCNFKVFALCLDRGALSRRLSPLQFYALYVAPITPKDELEGARCFITVAARSLLTFQTCFLPAAALLHPCRSDPSACRC